jgi:hypothetical protein
MRRFKGLESGQWTRDERLLAYLTVRLLPNLPSFSVRRSVEMIQVLTVPPIRATSLNTAGQ